MSVLLWKIFHDAIASDDKIMQKGISLVSKCQCCDSPHIETTEHIFFQGEKAKENWDRLALMFNKPPPMSVDNFWSTWMTSTDKSSSEILIKIAAICLVWELWIFRNKRKMEGITNNIYFHWQNWLHRLVQLIKPDRKSYSQFSTLCRNLKIKPPPSVINIVSHWSPAPHGLTLSCALVEKDDAEHFGFIIRESSGRFVYAANVISQAGGLLPNLASSITSCPSDIQCISMIQSSHPDMQDIAKKDIPWRHIRDWRKVEKRWPRVATSYTSASENNVALTIAYLPVAAEYPSSAYLPLAVYNSFSEDFKRTYKSEDVEPD